MLPSPLALTANDGAAAALLAAIAALVVVAAVRLARRVRPLPPPATPAEIERDLDAAAPAAPAPAAAPPPAPSVLAPSAAPPPSAPAGAAPAGPAGADAEDAEAAKRAAYRARKEEERLERERRRAERAAAEERARAEAARAEAEAEAARRAAAEEARRRAEAEAGKTLAAGLARTRGGFMARLDALLGGGGGALDAAGLAELEEILFTADIGVRTSTRLLETVRERVRARTLADPAALRGALRAEIARILALGAAPGAGPEAPATPGATRPWVVMVVGVNGSGKTTSIGKLGARLRAAGHSVLLGAGDTFRAAAGEQLEIWAERIGAPIVRGKDGSDPASVCFEAARRGAETGADVVLCDTAGRLHTKAPLMEELKKVQRVIGKAVPGAPHEVLLVLDATSGQNAIAQARQFHEALGVTGIVLTKLDGTAKGGVVIGITDELRIPVRWVGIGEAVADLRPFSPAEFVEALFA